MTDNRVPTRPPGRKRHTLRAVKAERVRLARAALLNPPSANPAGADGSFDPFLSPSQAWTVAGIALGAGFLAGWAGLSRPVLDASLRIALEQFSAWTGKQPPVTHET